MEVVEYCEDKAIEVWKGIVQRQLIWRSDVPGLGQQRLHAVLTQIVEWTACFHTQDFVPQIRIYYFFSLLTDWTSQPAIDRGI